jgi:hypothetical protein
MFSKLDKYNSYAKKGVIPLLCIFLLLNIFLLSKYIFHEYLAYFHSDSAAKVLLAVEIYDRGDFFPKDWNYVNSDLFIVFGHVFIIPLLKFMMPGYEVHAISGFISALLIMLGVAALLGAMKVPRTRVIAVLAVVSAGFSGFVAENFYGQVSYGPAIYLTCFLLCSCIHFLDDGRIGSGRAWAGLFFVILFLVVWANPVRALVIYCIPLFCALAYPLICDTSISLRSKNALKVLCCLLFFSIIVGGVLHILTLRGVNNVYGVAGAKWLSYDLMARNIGLLMQEFLAILGGIPPANDSVTSIWGIYFAARLMAALLIMVLVPFAVFRIFAKNSVIGKIPIIFSVIAFLIILFFQIFTSVPEMSDPIQSARYLVPSVFLLVLLTLVHPLDYKRDFIFSAALLAVFSVNIVSAYFNYFRSNINSQVSISSGEIIEGRAKFIEFLAENKLNYGYATFWNSGKNSVLSDGRSLIRQVLINGGLPMPMRHLSSNAWYLPDAWTGETFLMLNQEESKAIDWARMKRMGAVPYRVLKYEQFEFYVFKENIAGIIPGWDYEYRKEQSFRADPQSLTQVGKYIGSADNDGGVIVADKGARGAVHYGPYINVGAGNYVVTFNVDADFNEKGSVRLDVASAPDQRIINEITLDQMEKPFEMLVSVNKLRTLEFRVWALGEGKVSFKSVGIRRVID